MYPPFCQESISDFYWYYSGKDIIDEAGQRNFSRALAVAKQVFNSLTEYIQVPQHTVPQQVLIKILGLEKIDFDAV